MDMNGWAAAFGALARRAMSSPELERYFSIPITKARAQLILVLQPRLDRGFQVVGDKD